MHREARGLGAGWPAHCSSSAYERSSPMKTLTYALPMTLAFATGCSTALVDRSPASPSSPVSGGDVAPASACSLTGPGRTIAPRARNLLGIEDASSARQLAGRVAPRPDYAG